MFKRLNRTRRVIYSSVYIEQLYNTDCLVSRKFTSYVSRICEDFGASESKIEQKTYTHGWIMHMICGAFEKAQRIRLEACSF